MTARLPQSQPACKNDSAPTGLVDCGNWAVSASWTVPSDAVSGLYIAHLVRNDTGGSSLIPFVVRDDQLVQRPRVDPHMALNIDLAPTIAAAAGVEAPAVDGRSLLPLLAGRRTRWRHEFLIEHVAGRSSPEPPTFCAVRTERYMYGVYATGEAELYDLLGYTSYEERDRAYFGNK